MDQLFCDFWLTKIENAFRESQWSSREPEVVNRVADSQEDMHPVPSRWALKRVEDLAEYNAPLVPVLSTPLAYHEAYGAFVCLDCRCGVYKSDRSLANHLRDKHDCHPPTGFFDDFEVHDGHTPAAVADLNGCYPSPVTFLPVHSGFLCSCGFATTDPKSSKQHWSNVCPRFKPQRVSVQAWYCRSNGGQVVRWFPVQPLPAGHTATHADGLAADTFNLMVTYQTTLSRTRAREYGTVRPTRPGLQVLGWVELLSDVSSVHLNALMRHAQDNPAPDAEFKDPVFLCQVEEDVTDIYKQANDIAARGTTIQQQCFDTEFNNVPHHKSADTIRNQTTVLKSFMRFAFRVHCHVVPVPGIPLLPEATRQVMSHVVEGYTSIPPACDCQTRLMDAFMHLIFATVPSVATTPRKSLVTWWMPMRHKSGNSFAEATHISSELSYFAQGCRALLLLWGVRRTECEVVAPGAMDGGEHNASAAVTRLRSIVNDVKERLEGVSSGFERVVHARKKMKQELKSVVLDPNSELYSHRIVKVNDAIVSIDGIGATVRGLINRAATMLTDDLLFGRRVNRPHGDSQDPFAALCDDFGNRSAGWSFLDHDSNHFQGTDALLFQAINDTPHLRDKFRFTNREGKIYASWQACRDYNLRCEEFRRMLLVAIHLCYGAPARGTELSSTRFVNTVDGTRDVVVLNGRLALAISYNKTANLTGRALTITRMLCPALSELLLQYLMVVRPFEVILDQVLYSGGDKPLYPVHLFLVNRLPVTTEYLSTALKDYTSRFGMWNVTTSSYRHAFLVLARKNDIVFDRDSDEHADESGPDALLERQTGHSAQMGRTHYGRLSNPDEVLQAAQLTDRWAELIGAFNHTPQRLEQLPPPMEHSPLRTAAKGVPVNLQPANGELLHVPVPLGGKPSKGAKPVPLPRSSSPRPNKRKAGSALSSPSQTSRVASESVFHRPDVPSTQPEDHTTRSSQTFVDDVDIVMDLPDWGPQHTVSTVSVQPPFIDCPGSGSTNPGVYEIIVVSPADSQQGCELRFGPMPCRLGSPLTFS